MTVSKSKPAVKTPQFPVDIHIRTEQKVDALTKLVQALTRKVNAIMADLDQVKADEDAEAAAITGLSAAVTSLIATINSLKTALAGAPLSADNQAKVDAIFAEAETNKVAAQAALTAAQAAPTS
jgi:capsule polysaccharide export protein KpsE/RkpR